MSKTIKDYLPYYLGQDVNYPIDGSPFKLIGITESKISDFTSNLKNMNTELNKIKTK